MFTSDPHQNEYLAAVAGMNDHTMPPAERHEPAVGDFISGVTAGKRWSGHVEWVHENEVCINPGGAWINVPLKDITH